MNIKKDIIFPFLIGSSVYPVIELLDRGRTHYSMAIAGGICFFAVYTVNKAIPRSQYLLKVIFSAIIITEIEFITGCIVNIIFPMQVWDYSDKKYNVLGQICPQFSLYWFGLSMIVTVIADMISISYSISDKRHINKKITDN